VANAQQFMRMDFAKLYVPKLYRFGCLIGAPFAHDAV